MIKEVEHLSYEEKLKSQEHFSLEKECLRKGLRRAACSYVGVENSENFLSCIIPNEADAQKTLKILLLHLKYVKLWNSLL